MVISKSDQQIEKLDNATRLADRAAESSDVASRLGALVLYAGLVDFAVIQAARLVEQIVLKGQLAEEKKPKFKPNDDSYFYSHKVSTRRILKGIRMFLPFHALNSEDEVKAAHVTVLATKMVDDAFSFLNYRNPLLHQIGNPVRSFDGVLAMIDKAIVAYRKFFDSHKAFFEAAAPYRFSHAELAHVYGEGEQAGT